MYLISIEEVFSVELQKKLNTITVIVGGSGKRNYRSVITREAMEPPACFNFSN